LTDNSYVAAQHSKVLQRSFESAQYACTDYRCMLARNGLEQSVSRRGNCLDNAPMESFFASLKTEHVHQAHFRTREQARAAVFDNIQIFYNCSSQRTSPYVIEAKRFC
jgi:putative transposase